VEPLVDWLQASTLFQENDMRYLTFLVGLVLAAVLAACGGGGGSAGATSGSSGTSPTGTPTIAMELRDSANAVTNSIGTGGVVARATVKDASGAPVSGRVVTFAGDASLIAMTPSSGQALTDANGVASVQIVPASATSAGAGTLNASATVGASALTTFVDFQITSPGRVAKVVIELRNAAGAITNAVSGTGVSARAVVTDASGLPVVGKVVSFSGAANLIGFSPASGQVLTDAAGVATIQVIPANPTAAGAGTLNAGATVGALAVTGSLDYQVTAPAAGTPKISVELRSPSDITTNVVTASGATARATVRDSSGLPVIGRLVTFTGSSALLRFTPASGQVLTDLNGVASIQVNPASAQSAGAGSLNVSSTVDGNVVAASMDFNVAAQSSSGVAQMTIELRDANNVSTTSVSGAGATARAVVRDASGNVVAGKLVTFTADATLVRFVPASGTVLTDASGVASIQVSAASLNAAGAGTLNAATTVGTAAVTAAFDYQLSAASVGLTSLDLGSGSLAAFGNRAISVVATVNGVAAANTPIQVTFQASCGVVNPATVTTDSSGRAATTYSANNITCAGSNVSISASAPGATALQGAIAVSASQPTNVQFVSASPQLIYLVGSVGATQSQLTFKVVDSNGSPLQNQSVLLSLVTSSGTGVSIGTVGNTSTVTLSTDVSGQVAVPVFSGTVPTSVQVRAALAANSSIFAASNLLTVASGRAVQSAASMAVSKFAIEGFNIDGPTTDLTMSLADRQGNPVPDGTQVNFVAESGVLVPPVCVVSGGTSSCRVTLRSQGTRPSNGIVAVLGYVPGEENFVDANFNNVYDTGESFSDLGNAFRDDNDDSLYSNGEFTVPRAGSQACTALIAGATANANSRPGTCDGVWGAADIRVQANVIFATSFANIQGGIVNNTVGATTATQGQLTVTIADQNNNSMPTGSGISISVTSPTSSGCTATNPVTVISNSLRPLTLTIPLAKCIRGDSLTVTVTSPNGNVTASTFSVTTP
jgi:hypothetical protein